MLASILLMASMSSGGGDAGHDYYAHYYPSCYSCYGCYGCYGCHGCYNCYGCYGCHSCYGCYGCHGCHCYYGCHNCYGCYGCYDCYGCYGCYDCHWYGHVPHYHVPITVVQYPVWYACPVPVILESEPESDNTEDTNVENPLVAESSNQGKVMTEMLKTKEDSLEKALNGINHRLDQLEEKVDKISDPRGFPPENGPAPFPGSGVNLKDRALVVVHMPKNAALFLNNRKMKESPLSVRKIITPKLEPGARYNYDVRVETFQNGDALIFSHRVSFQAGKEIHVNFDKMNDHGAPLVTVQAK